MVREFKLINEKGQEFSLMDIENHILLTDPSGLGYAYETEYQQLNNTFIMNLRKFQQGQISGTANFLEYDNYKAFVDFVEISESLKFRSFIFSGGDLQILLLWKTRPFFFQFFFSFFQSFQLPGQLADLFFQLLLLLFQFTDFLSPVFLPGRGSDIPGSIGAGNGSFQHAHPVGSSLVDP